MKIRNAFWERWLQASTIPIVIAGLFYRYNTRLFGIFIERPYFQRTFKIQSTVLVSVLTWMVISTYMWPSK
jgi:hypothetical protein